MNPKCPKCRKTVYPMEKLNLLDQFWHKGCFKCHTCETTLNVKNYKGYDKLPYCHAHYPTTKFTQVAETPEMARVKKNTTIQSSVNYTKDQRKLQGTKTSVADDPETRRIKLNTKNQSLAQYHGLSQQRSTENYRRDLEAGDLEGTNRQDMPLPPQPTSPTTYNPGYNAVGKDPSPKQVGSLFGAAEPDNVSYHPPPAQEAPPPIPASQQPLPDIPKESTDEGPLYKAVYDYDAAADDEVSFMEGDIILNGQEIDDGWMTGTVQRTGETGMLPSNYVENA